MTYQPTLQSPTRWAACDITYVREQYSSCSAREIAQDLGMPLRRVHGLISRIGLRKKDAAIQKASAERCKPNEQIVPHGARSAASGPGGTCATPASSNAPEGPIFQPADLAGFLSEVSLREVALALKVSRTTAHRLKHGYWPSDNRAILHAWGVYKGRSAQQVSGWFLRRVHVGGLVRHAGREWTAPRLSAHTGQTLAVARTVDGGLLAQTLELPSKRMQLVPMAELLGGGA